MSTPTPSTATPEQPAKPRMVRNIVLLSISAALFALAGWILFHRQYVIDEMRLYRYTPSAEVKSIAATTTMHGDGQRYFYVSHPEIDTRQTFNQHCSDQGEQTIVLGCYKGFDIYIYDVNDPRLPGVEDVTAAHEMLHAAYDRLSDGDRQHVDALVKAEVDRISDPRLLDLIKVYNKTEPGELLNEMHSIIGTEVRDISPELETYYARYFSDRKKVVSLSEGYEKVFSNLKDQQDSLSSQLDQLNGEIHRRTDALNSGIQSLNNDIADFNRRAKDGDFTSQAQFQEERDKLAARQAALSAERNAINDLISRFNSIREQLANLNLQAQSLNQSLDSKPPEQVPSL